LFLDALTVAYSRAVDDIHVAAFCTQTAAIQLLGLSPGLLLRRTGAGP
jgi:hypothetical protein